MDGNTWDTHNNIATDLQRACDRTDQPVAALLQDLKQRGLLDSTLVIWNAFCTWMAGGGIKGGTTHGTTDDIGLRVVEDSVSVADWHATILHLLGLRQDQLFLDQNGLKEKLTGVEGAAVVKGILA